MRASVLVLIAALLTAACTGSSSPELTGRSSAAVLVPVDARFRTTFTLLVQDSPDNYTYRTNWSASFDPEVDPALTVVGYQVNDPENWSGGAETGDGLPERDAAVAAVDDSRSPSTGGPCVTLDPSIQLMVCSYEVGSSAGPLEIAVRRFDETSAVLLALFAGHAANDFLSGDFETVPLDQAIEAWG